MVRCNLQNILQKQNLSISKLSEDTGISRTTLHALLTNKSKGIQFDTINTLCNYLNVNINDLLEYSSFNISFSLPAICLPITESSIFELWIIIKNKNNTLELPIVTDIEIENYVNMVYFIRVNFYLPSCPDSRDVIEDLYEYSFEFDNDDDILLKDKITNKAKKDSQLLKYYLSKLSDEAFFNLKNNIQQEISQNITINTDNAEIFETEFNWFELF